MRKTIKKILKPFQSIMQKAIGVNDIKYKFEHDISALQESNDAIFYYLNNYLLKAKDLPPTSDPDLRIMQLCDAEMLKIVDKILTKHNLIYWLDFGTLLGAVRHKGFIPWDDDMDISVPEETYYETLRVLQEELAKYPGFSCCEEPHCPYARICVGYNHESTGIWLDIFPTVSVPYIGEKEEYLPILKDKIWEYKQFYSKHKDKLSIDEITKAKKKIIPYLVNSNKHLHFTLVEFWHETMKKEVYYDDQDLYPLVDVTFENYTFKAPANLDLILNQNYSNSYMELARSGVLHHGEGRTPLSSWAKQHNVNMKEVLQELHNINKSI